MTTKKPKPNILQWVAIWFLAVLLSALVFNAARASAQIASGASHTPNRVFACRNNMAKLVRGPYMSSATANRISYKICRDLRDGKLGTDGKYYYDAMTRNNGRK